MEAQKYKFKKFKITFQNIPLKNLKIKIPDLIIKKKKKEIKIPNFSADGQIYIKIVS